MYQYINNNRKYRKKLCTNIIIIVNVFVLPPYFMRCSAIIKKGNDNENKLFTINMTLIIKKSNNTKGKNGH